MAMLCTVLRDMAQPIAFQEQLTSFWGPHIASSCLMASMT